VLKRFTSTEWDDSPPYPTTPTGTGFQPLEINSGASEWIPARPERLSALQNRFWRPRKDF
jgi:hypothetical protein